MHMFVCIFAFVHLRVIKCEEKKKGQKHSAAQTKKCAHVVLKQKNTKLSLHYKCTEQNEKKTRESARGLPG
jgi:Na+-translocating ferredoxin:NAD+ oxidoreductase RnfG subunit